MNFWVQFKALICFLVQKPLWMIPLYLWKMYIILAMLLVTLTKMQTLFEVLSAPEEDGDLGFLRALNNYFGCKTWEDNQCIECSPGHFFNDNRICCQVSPNCQKFNRAVGICEQCYTGFEIFDGKCEIKDLRKSKDKGCKKFQDGQCVECSKRWFFGPSGFCEPVSDDCRKWDETQGFCTACYLGYRLTEEGRCERVQNSFVRTTDPFCSKWNGQKCEQCALRAFFGPIGMCIPVSDYCNTWDRFDGFCLSCYKGYQLANGKCDLAPEKGPSDLGCKLWDWDQKICLECSKRWRLDRATGECKQTSTYCKTLNIEGQCESCYKGFQLIQGACVVQKLAPPPDPGCRVWDWDALQCHECSHRWIFNDRNKCIKVSPHCQTFGKRGQCETCYKGYEVINGTCVRAAPSYCMIEKNGKCEECYPGYSLKNGKCVLGNPLCRSSDRYGNCTSCFPTYILYKNICVPLVKLVNVAVKLAECCPEQLKLLKQEAKVV